MHMRTYRPECAAKTLRTQPPPPTPKTHNTNNTYTQVEELAEEDRRYLSDAYKREVGDPRCAVYKCTNTYNTSANTHTHTHTCTSAGWVGAARYIFSHEQSVLRQSVVSSKSSRDVHKPKWVTYTVSACFHVPCTHARARTHTHTHAHTLHTPQVIENMSTSQMVDTIMINPTVSMWPCVTCVCVCVCVMCVCVCVMCVCDVCVCIRHHHDQCHIDPELL